MSHAVHPLHGGQNCFFGIGRVLRGGILQMQHVEKDDVKKKVDALFAHLAEMILIVKMKENGGGASRALFS